MKRILISWGLLSLVVACPAVELKVATMDLQRALTGYYKAEEATKEIHAKEVSFRKELEDLRLERTKLANEAEDLRRLSLDNALHADARAEKRKNFELKLVDLRAFEVKAEGIQEQLGTELRKQVARTNERLLDDILKAANRVGEQEGFHLILNANKSNPTTSDVLFARGVEDVTPKVLAVLNATKPSPKSESDKR